MSKLNIEGFSVEATDRFILVDKLPVTPAEVERVTRLIGTARRMQGFAGLPESIEDYPFKILFSEDGNFKLGRKDSTELVNFTFDRADDLVKAFDEGLKCSINAQVLRTSPRGSAYEPRSTGDVFEGRG